MNLVRQYEFLATLLQTLAREILCDVRNISIMLLVNLIQGANVSRFLMVDI